MALSPPPWCPDSRTFRSPSEHKEYHRTVFGKAVIEPKRCVGCGLCVTACPERAIAFRERPDYAGIPDSVQSMTMQVLREKGKLEQFMALMR